MSLIDKPYFKNLVMVDVFEYYDMPRIFTCRAPAGQLYFVQNCRETTKAAMWVYVAVSPKRMEVIRRQRLDLRDAVLRAEDGVAYLVTTWGSLGAENRKVRPYKSDHNKIRDLLPDAGQMLTEA